MKHFLIFLFLCTSALESIGQQRTGEHDYVLGPLFKISKKEVPIEFIDADREGFYVYYERVSLSGRGQKTIKKFSYKLEPVDEVSLSEGSFSRFDSYAAFMLGNRMYHVSVKYVPASSSRELVLKNPNVHLQQINKSDLSLEPRLPLAQLATDGEAIADIDVIFSQDSSLFAVAYSIMNKKNEPDRMGVHVLRADNMEVIWEDRVILPYTDKLMEVQDFLLGATGEFYILGKRFKGKAKNKRNGQANYDFMFFEFDESKLLDSIKFEAGDRFLRDLRMGFAPNGDILTGGIFSNEGMNGTGGLFFMSLDGTTKAVLSTSFKDFDLDILTANMTEKQAKKVEKNVERGDDVELPYFYINEFISQADGSVQMLAEERQIRSETRWTQGMNGMGPTTYEVFHFYYRDILVVNINREGEIDWVEKVAKNQHSVNDNGIYSSFATAIVADAIYLIYNDNRANLNYSGTGRVAQMSSKSSTYIALNKVQADGTSTRSPFLSMKETETIIRPQLTMQVTDDEVLLFGHKKLKKQQFILVKLEE